MEIIRIKIIRFAFPLKYRRFASKNKKMGNFISIRMLFEYIVYVGIAYNASLKPWDESRYFIP